MDILINLSSVCELDTDWFISHPIDVRWDLSLSAIENITTLHQYIALARVAYEIYFVNTLQKQNCEQRAYE